MADVETKEVGKIQTIGDRKLCSYSSSYTRVPDTKQVKVVHLTKCGDDQLAYHGYTLDLSNVSESELIENAAKNINIQFIRPRVFRKEKAQVVLDNYDESKVVDAAEIMAQVSSKTKDPVVAATNLAAKMTPEQMKEAIAAMQASMDARQQQTNSNMPWSIEASEMITLAKKLGINTTGLHVRQCVAFEQL